MNQRSVIFLTKYQELAASSRLRAYQYLPWLSSDGFSCSVWPLFDNRYLKDRFSGKRFNVVRLIKFFFARLFRLLCLKKTDVIILHIELFPYLPPVFEWILFKTKVRVILDYDDAVFHIYSSSPNLYINKVLKNKIGFLMANSDGVICGNKYIEQYARISGAKKTFILPTVVDISQYKISVRRDGRKFTIGWIGSPSTLKYLYCIKNALSTLAKSIPIRLYIIGGGKPVCIDNVEVVYDSWSLEKEQKGLAEFNIGIMPLNNTNWEKGKCGFKLIQYMASSLPVVASSVGMNEILVKNGVNGFLVNNDAQWVNAINKLYRNKELREKMGKAGRKLVEAEYTVQKRHEDLKKIIRSA